MNAGWKINNRQRILFLLVVILLGIGFTGCKSQKKLARQREAAELAAKVDKAKKDLLMVINDQGAMTIAQKEKIVADVKALNLRNPEVDALIIEAERAIERARLEEMRREEERLRREREERERQETTRREEEKFSKIEDYFDAIATARTVEQANARINDALKFFASPDVPVLIIVYMDANIRDYDRPTTIRNYLEYLKDQKKNPNKVHNIQYDATGKITEIELIKKY